jgi:hypothetical protein
MLVLALADVEPGAIAADYAVSRAIEEDGGAEIAAFLAERGTTGEQLILDTLASIDVEATLRRGGATGEDFARVRARLRADGG